MNRMLLVGLSLMLVATAGAQVVRPVPVVDFDPEAANGELRKIPPRQGHRFSPGELVELVWSGRIRFGEILNFDPTQGYLIEMHHVPGGLQTRTYRSQDEIRLVHPSRALSVGDAVDVERLNRFQRGVVSSLNRTSAVVQTDPDGPSYSLKRMDASPVYSVPREPLRQWSVARQAVPMIARLVDVSFYTAGMQTTDGEIRFVPLDDFQTRERIYLWNRLAQIQRSERAAQGQWEAVAENHPLPGAEQPQPVAGVAGPPPAMAAPGRRPRTAIAPTDNPAVAAVASPEDVLEWLALIRDPATQPVIRVSTMVRMSRTSLPPSCHQEVFDTVGPLLSDETNTVHANAFRVLQQAGFSNETIPWLLKAYERNPKAAAEEMASLPTPEVIAFLKDRVEKATRITDPVFGAIETMGSPAEELAWIPLRSNNIAMRSRALRVIESIGTQSSIDFFEQQQMTSEPQVQSVIRKIQKRESP